MGDGSASDFGVVAIGRNEGDRLRRCLASARAAHVPVVYVDSGSTDGSVTVARELGATVVELDLSIPFTAARARNAGFRALLQQQPRLDFVQFVDGDCELAEGWLDRAAAALAAEPQLAGVLGRRRERHRDASPWNRLCDIEWAIPVGLVESCGGDVMFRVRALQAVSGYDDSLIAGEEPELCLRLRDAGWRLRCIGGPMTIHDAAMHSFGQWWRRAMRAGYVLAEGVAMYGRRYPRWRFARSVLCWALLLPVAAGAAAAAAAVVFGPAVAAAPAVVLVAAYAAQWWRVRQKLAPVAEQPGDAGLYALACIGGKWPELHGMVEFWRRRLFAAERRLIEYKTVARS
jgi:glycosyltransferase involved in cell wall biosynthesis